MARHSDSRRWTDSNGELPKRLPVYVRRYNGQRLCFLGYASMREHYVDIGRAVGLRGCDLLDGYITWSRYQDDAVWILISLKEPPDADIHAL